MNRLYVRFPGDNDLVNTLQAFMRSVAPRVLLDRWGDITKEQVVQLFNHTAFALYQLHQTYDLPADNSTKNYLKISTKDVYFDEEIDSFTSHNGDGCMAVLEHDRIGYYIM